jgi:hypothetical protein
MFLRLRDNTSAFLMHVSMPLSRNACRKSARKFPVPSGVAIQMCYKKTKLRSYFNYKLSNLEIYYKMSLTKLSDKHERASNETKLN